MILSGVNIRTANKKDKEAILKICEQIWDGNDYIQGYIDEWLQQNDSYLFVIEYNNDITHFVRLKLQPDHTGWIEGMRGHPEYRRMGLARILTKYVINFSSNIGLNKLRFATYFLNSESISLFGKFGFSIIYKYLIGSKNSFNINKGNIFSVFNLNYDYIDEIKNFLSKSEIYKLYGRFFTNGWHFEKYSDELCMNWLKKGYFYSIKNKGSIYSLMCLVPQNNNPNNEIISFIDSRNKEKMDLLLNFAESRAYKNKSNLEFISPTYSKLSKYMVDKKYRLWHPTEENVYLFEKKIVK